MSLGNKLAALRKNSNMTQEALGKRLDISAQAVSKWENDLSEPDMATLKKLSSIYNVPIAEFYDLKDTGNQSKNDDTVITYKVLITDCNNTSKFTSIERIMNLYNLSFTDAKSIVESLPYTLEYANSFDEAQKIKDSLETADGFVAKIEECVFSKNTVMGLCTDCGKSVTIDSLGSTAGELLCKHCKKKRETDKAIEKSLNEDALKSTFKIANIFAAIPALIWLIFGLCNLGSTFLLVLENLAFTIVGTYMLFSTIFQLFYKTAVRFIVGLPMRISKAVRSEVDGCFMFILYIVIYIVALIATIFTFAIGLCVAPFTYPISLKKRIENIKAVNENEVDEIMDIMED